MSSINYPRLNQIKKKLIDELSRRHLSISQIENIALNYPEGINYENLAKHLAPFLDADPIPENSSYAIDLNKLVNDIKRSLKTPIEGKENTCKSACQGLCTNACTNLCLSSCGNSCSSCGGCAGTCNGCSGCTGGCQGGCSSCKGCTSQCSKSCGNTCSNTCQGSCSNTCGGSCIGISN